MRVVSFCAKSAMSCSNNSASRSSHCSRVVRSIEKVTSVLSDLRGRSGSTGRRSIPRQRSDNSIPNLPKRSTSSAREKRWSSPQVLTPSSSNFRSVLAPIPQILRTANFSMKSGTSPGFTSSWPFGLFTSLAILAMSLFGPIPADEVSFVF